MISQLPVETMNGRSEWDWNDRQVSRGSSDPSDGTDKDDSSEAAVAPRHEVQQLETELERKEQQLRNVTEQYELLLEEKNRQLADRNESRSERELRSTFRSVISRYVTDRP